MQAEENVLHDAHRLDELHRLERALHPHCRTAGSRMPRDVDRLEGNVAAAQDSKPGDGIEEG
jgi:hypothetical protein